VNSVHRGIWRPEDRAASIYQYVPVEVGAGHRALRVELAYDRSTGVLDLGCLDPTGAFRGWSGGARDAFTIAETWSTPGYLPGPLAAGQWQVMLGLHRVPAGGLPWEVTVSAMADPGPAPGSAAPLPPWPHRPARPGPTLPAPAGYRWLAGDLHAHSVHSDGASTISELAQLGARVGLDFLAITDHNTVSHHPWLPDESGILLLPGQEVTTARGHANAYGDIGWVDFRQPADDWLSTVKDRGGLLSINHPLAGDVAWLHPLQGRPRLVEVWHSGWWDRTWTAPLSWLLAFDPSAVPVGGSDFHDPAAGDRLGTPTTWVLCPVADPREATVGVLLDALAAGPVAVGDSPVGPVLLRLGDELVAVGADGAVLTDFTGERRPVLGDRVSFPAVPGPHWLEDHRAQVLAVTC
jgi:predicted metal-dependent phosphoesterase TrpH